MQHCDTLILPAWCVPVEPRGEVLENAAVAVTDGRIVSVLPADEAGLGMGLRALQEGSWSWEVAGSELWLRGQMMGGSFEVRLQRA